MYTSPSSRNSDDPFGGGMKKMSPDCVSKKEHIYCAVLTIIHPEDGGGDVLRLTRVH